MKELLLVAATRRSEDDFRQNSLLGRSLPRVLRRADGGIKVRIFAGNSMGLPFLYNRVISEENRERIVVFLHDDVWLDDFFIPERLNEAVQAFDIVGLAGSSQRLTDQPSWAFVEKGKWHARDALSGSVAHMIKGEAVVSHYGAAPRECQALDGVFLAARCSALLDAGVRFDTRFSFHFYDLDFCRQATERGLKLGTWPIAVTHASGGNFADPAWDHMYKVYLEKWQGNSRVEALHEPLG